MTTKPHPRTVRMQATIKKVKSLTLKENSPIQRFISSKLEMSSGPERKIIHKDLNTFSFGQTRAQRVVSSNPGQLRTRRVKGLLSSRSHGVEVWRGGPSSAVQCCRGVLNFERVPVTRYYQENTIERHRYGGAGWLVWGGIILGSRTDLHVQSVTMTGHIYRVVILEQHARLFRGAMGSEFLFMDDNARPHRANIVDECLQSEDITRMDWPAYSPDLNPIEHVWDMLGRRIAARQPPPTCLPELRRALLDEWYNIPQDQIDNLILSMPRRCKACIASSGRHTPY
ncbi:transposable element Tc3 transposase [Trichonephila clavipes]|nr:transposable element Tc3 transposase [Trichonephila clavipes]